MRNGANHSIVVHIGLIGWRTIPLENFEDGQISTFIVHTGLTGWNEKWSELVRSFHWKFSSTDRSPLEVLHFPRSYQLEWNGAVSVSTKFAESSSAHSRHPHHANLLAEFILETNYPSQTNYPSKTRNSSTYKSGVKTNYWPKFLFFMIGLSTGPQDMLTNELQLV